MTMKFTVGLLLVTAAIVASGCNTDPSAPEALPDTASAVDAARAFHDHLKAGRIEQAQSMLQMADGPWVGPLRERYAAMSRGMQKGRQDFAVVEGRARGHCAAIIINENLKPTGPTYDLESLYLVHRGGEWRVLARGNRYRHAIHALTSAELADFNLLEQWCQARMNELEAGHAAGE
jgi:hypothetical protein